MMDEIGVAHEDLANVNEAIALIEADFDHLITFK